MLSSISWRAPQMSDSIRVCFDLSSDEFQALQFYAQNKGYSSESFVRHIIRERLEAYIKSAATPDADRRKEPRIEVSIPAVSLVNFPDNTSRSYPVTIRDLSKGGLKISFAEVDNSLYQKLRNATDFEIVFTVPKTVTTVAFSCKVCRISYDNSVLFAGRFDCECASGIRILDNLFN